MKPSKFNKMVKKRLKAIEETLIAKATEYANGEDRLHNFNTAVLMAGEETTKKQCLHGMKLKHDVAVNDLIFDRCEVSEYLINEKIGDSICYLILLEAMLWDELEEREK